MLATSPEVQRKESNNHVEVVQHCQSDLSAAPLQVENGSVKNEDHISESDESPDTSSEVTKTNNNDSSSTEQLTDSYLADESSINANSEISNLATDDCISQPDHISDRTSPSKSIPEISESLTDSENHEQSFDSETNQLTVSKLDSVALNSRSSSRNRSISSDSVPNRTTSSDSSPNASLEPYEEFTSKEIAEAKQAVDFPTEHVPINPDLTSTPEPHSASPIKEVLLTLQKEASKYRNIQVNMLLAVKILCQCYKKS